jgi:hypothetical protein
MHGGHAEETGTNPITILQGAHGGAVIALRSDPSLTTGCDGLTDRRVRAPPPSPIRRPRQHLDAMFHQQEDLLSSRRYNQR